MSPRAIEADIGAVFAGYALIAAVIAVATMPLFVNHGAEIFRLIRHAACAG